MHSSVITSSYAKPDSNRHFRRSSPTPEHAAHSGGKYRLVCLGRFSGGLSRHPGACNCGKLPVQPDRRSAVSEIQQQWISKEIKVERTLNYFSDKVFMNREMGKEIRLFHMLELILKSTARRWSIRSAFTTGTMMTLQRTKRRCI